MVSLATPLFSHVRSLSEVVAPLLCAVCPLPSLGPCSPHRDLHNGQMKRIGSRTGVDEFAIHANLDVGGITNPDLAWMADPPTSNCKQCWQDTKREGDDEGEQEQSIVLASQTDPLLGQGCRQFINK